VHVLDLHDVVAVIIALVAAAVFAAMIWAGNRVH
jgi:threonine/homoserine efflux transporter RhtA